MNRKRALRLSLVAPAAFMTLAAVQPTSFAATAPFKPTFQTKSVSLNGKVMSTPKGFTYNNTVYLPAYYVMHALDSIGIKSDWDGTKHTWKMTVPSTMKTDFSDIKVGTGTISIYVNNKLIKKINGMAFPDPASGVPTTYLPAWYAMGLFNDMGVTTTWDGTHWVMKQAAVTPTPPPAPQSPPDTNPQAKDVGAVSKETLVNDLMTTLGASVTTPASSPYDDVPVTDPDIGAVTAAVNANYTSAWSTTHFGAGDAVTLLDAEQFYWNYLHIQQGQYQPGQTVQQWANLIGLENNVSQTQYLTPADEQTFLANLSTLLKGYSQSGTSYLVHYTPEDEYAATFAGTSYFSSTSDIQTAIVNTYNFFNSVTVQQQGSYLVATVPLSPDATWFAYGTTTNDIQYSVDGGLTWTSAPNFDSTTLAYRPSQVLLKVNASDGINLTFNKMMASAKGSVVLGGVNIYVDPATGLQVHRIDF